MEQTRKRLRNRVEESRRKRSEGMSHDISATGEKSFEDVEDLSKEESMVILSDDDEDIEELSSVAGSVELRQRKSKKKSAEESSC